MQEPIAYFSMEFGGKAHSWFRAAISYYLLYSRYAVHALATEDGCMHALVRKTH
ncbi:hypothetical protein [Thiomonas sp. FB-Cd]|uniref:hypothetical protein n=1 Tax=Thiomonas sp. FB-Cd TaxID=1158292 RepID=UPI000AC82F91|nr:hypothetical protein [Thiomonas sp. FB-Cd]